MPVYCANGAVPFSQTVEARGAEEGMKADVDCVLSHIGFNMISDREVEVRCAFKHKYHSYRKDLRCIGYRCKYWTYG